MKKSTKPSDLELALHTHVIALCTSERNTANCPEGLDRARDYLRTAFDGMGYQTVLQEFPADGMICANVEAVTPGFVGCDKPHLTDTAPYRNAHYHLASDTPEKLNYPIMALLTARIAQAVEGLLK